MTADYTVAPGLGLYAEIDLTSNERWDGVCPTLCDNDATIFIMGVNVNF